MIARILFLLFIVPAALLASPDTEWNAIVEMDCGPKKKPSSRDDAQLIARAYLTAQKSLIDEFLKKYPTDPHAFDAKMRLASILATQGNMDSTSRPITEALAIYSTLETDPAAPSEKHANAGFRRISLYLQTLRGQETEKRSEIVGTARTFVDKYPGDRRGPRLLVEVATICDVDPRLKRQLLEQARELSKEVTLNHRIADDIKRLDLLDKPLPLKFSTIQHGTFDTAEHKGDVIVVIFWSAESPQCLLWLKTFLKNIALLPKANLQIATVSLDSKRDMVTRKMAEFGIDSWPTNFEGTGWQSAIARPMGINSLPTVFILDKAGILRAINAQENYGVWVPKLQSQP